MKKNLTVTACLFTSIYVAVALKSSMIGVLKKLDSNKSKVENFAKKNLRGTKK